MKALVIANWKMNPMTAREAKKLASDTRRVAATLRGVSVVICPPAIFVRDVATRTGKTAYGVQNIHSEPRGSYTGDISAPQAKDAGASYAIIGHAERRALGETDSDVRKKVDAALTSHLAAVVCVGEKSRGEDAQHFETVRAQILEGISDEAGRKLSKIIIAYEPVWAIGAQAAMEPGAMHEMAIFIRKTLVERFGEAGHRVPILYGGAVDASNAASMLRDGDVAGFLVGRASVDGDAFSALLRAIAQA